MARLEAENKKLKQAVESAIQKGYLPDEVICAFCCHKYASRLNSVTYRN